MDWKKFFRKIEEKTTGTVRLTKDEIKEQLQQSCWDLFISNLPNPVIIDVEEEKAKGKEEEKAKVPDQFAKGVPRGFAIDPNNNWTVYFNMNDLPQYKKKQDAKDDTRSIGHHENTHYTVCPGSKRMDVRLVDAALKGFSSPQLTSNPQTAAAAAHIVENVFGDWVGDYMLGVDGYGREDFTRLTRNRMKRTIDYVAGKTKKPSTLWKVLVGTYEKMFDEDFGLSKYAPLSYEEKKYVDNCVRIMGNDFKESDNWPSKVTKLSGVLEKIILESCEQKSGNSNQQGQGGGLQLPKDVESQMGKEATESPMKGKGAGKSELQREEEAKEKKEAQAAGMGKQEQENTDEKNIDGEVLEEIFKLNRKNPSQFAGTLAAVMPVETEEAMRLMYRARARDYLIKITETRDKGSFATPSCYENWNIGDPVTGRGGIELVPSMRTTGVIIPGMTTVKRDYEERDLPGTMKQIADLYIIIDSSGSMDWNPLENNEEQRGSFDKAIIAGESAILYAKDHGAKAAATNFSSGSKHQDFTNELTKLEQTLMYHFGGGTNFPVSKFDESMKKNKNKVVCCIISDFEVSNVDESYKVITKYANKDNPCYLFDIGGRANLAEMLEKHEGCVRFKIRNMKDLQGIVIGKLRENYEQHKYLLAA